MTPTDGTAGGNDHSMMMIAGGLGLGSLGGRGPRRLLKFAAEMVRIVASPR
jgi:hypothetical protein